MLTSAQKSLAAIIDAMLGVSEKQLAQLAGSSNNDKMKAAVEHLQHCRAEIADAVKQFKPTEMKWEVDKHSLPEGVSVALVLDALDKRASCIKIADGRIFQIRRYTDGKIRVEA